MQAPNVAEFLWFSTRNGTSQNTLQATNMAAIDYNPQHNTPSAHHSLPSSNHAHLFPITLIPYINRLMYRFLPGFKVILCAHNWTYQTLHFVTWESGSALWFCSLFFFFVFFFSFWIFLTMLPVDHMTSCLFQFTIFVSHFWTCLPVFQRKSPNVHLWLCHMTNKPFWIWPNLKMAIFM